MTDRPSRDSENDNLKPGAPPRPRTEPAGRHGAADAAPTRTDPATGESGGDPGPNDSAAEDRSPAAPTDRRARPDV